MACTIICFRIRLQKRLSEVMISILPRLQIIFIEPQMVLFEVLVFQPTTQLPKNVIQPLGEAHPVVSRIPVPTKSSRIEVRVSSNPSSVGNIPLRPDKKEARLENLDIVECSDRFDNMSASSKITIPADG